ncbi:helix-turn-helix transcriptional regulator [Hirschia litorea]|uniref:Helix-turn-helix transcriptional regulator n=1 Tax=Hirschia litorea TaxID=1199156 RepID=A0ABW2IP19_9PROT
MAIVSQNHFRSNAVHPDVQQPLNLRDIPHANDTFHTFAKVDHKNKPFSGRQFDLDGLVIRHITVEDFDMEYTFSGHIIELNITNSVSNLALNSDRLKPQSFEENTVTYFQKGCHLKRTSQRTKENEAKTEMIALIIEPGHFETYASEFTNGGSLNFVDYDLPQKMPSIYRAQSALQAMFKAPDRYCKLTAEFVANDILIRSLHRWSNLGGVPNSNHLKSDDQKINKALEFIHANLTTSISLKDICSAVNLSFESLSSGIRRTTGQTPHNYLINARINLIKNQLSHSNESIADLAKKYQFSSPSHLASAFKKIVGDTPRNYRKNS